MVSVGVSVLANLPLAQQQMSRREVRMTSCRFRKVISPLHCEAQGAGRGKRETDVSCFYCVMAIFNQRILEILQNFIILIVLTGF